MTTYIAFLFFFVFTITVKGQDVTVYGRVTCADKEVKIESVVGIQINYKTQDNSYLTFEDVDKKGFYSRKLEKANILTLETNYDGFYAEKVIVEVGIKDSIRIDFKLIPKPYIFTAEKAIKDTRNEKIQLITFDTLEYKWTRKINLKKDFGFDYVLLAKPEDDDFEDNIDEYNAVVEKYLESKKHNWQQLLNIVRDSVVNSEADEYGRKKQIDIKKIKFPEMNRLPKGMQERLNTFQRNYNSWYKDKLKDYTVNHTLEIIKTDKDYQNFSLLPERISIDYQIFLPELIKLLTNDTEIGLVGYNGIMFCRGLAPPPGPWGCVAIPYSNDDLFTVAGRANHLLKSLTNEDFGNILPNPDEAYLKKLQNRWAYWALQLQNKL